MEGGFLKLRVPPKPSAYLKEHTKGSAFHFGCDTRHALVPLVLTQKHIHPFGAEETGIKLSNLPHNRVVLERISQTDRHNEVVRAHVNVVKKLMKTP